MPKCKHLAPALILASLVGVSARANISAKLVLGAQGISGVPQVLTSPAPGDPGLPAGPNPITYTPPSPQPSAGAKTDDNTLSNYTTYDLQVTLTNSTTNNQAMDFISAGITFKLTSGNFYIPGTQNSQFATGPNTWVTPTRHKEYDTWVSVVRSFDSRTDSDGNDMYEAPLLFKSNTDPNVARVFNSTTVDVQWGDLAEDYNQPGQALVYTLGRFTVLNGSKGFLSGSVSARDTLGNRIEGIPILVDVSAAGSFTPEPASLSLLGLAAGFMLRRPKRRV